MIKLSSSQKTTVNKIASFIKVSENLKKLGMNSLIEYPEISEIWIVSPEGDKLRLICGARSSSEGICYLPAGFGTNHSQKGHCKRHSRSLLYNPHLNALEGMPVVFGDLLAHVDLIEESVLQNVDHEIKFLYVLQQYLLTMSSEDRYSYEVIEQLQELTMNLVKAKSIKNKIQREIRLDVTSIKEFVRDIFAVIVKQVPGPQAQNILNDIMNQVIIPYQSRDKIQGASPLDFRENLNKVLKSAEAKVGE